MLAFACRCLAAAGLAVAGLAAQAASPVMVDADGVAANGYDVVAYFDGRVARGIPTFQIEFNGATWYFESQDNAISFQRDPYRYAPQFGGYCAYGVSQGYLVGTDPQAWSVVDGKLYLNYNVSIRGNWLRSVDQFVAIAKKHWPRLIA